jgi:hypothetical protein
MRCLTADRVTDRSTSRRPTVRVAAPLRPRPRALHSWRPRRERRCRPAEIDLVDTARSALPSRNHAIILVSQLNLPVMRAISYAKATRPNYLQGLTVQVNTDEGDRLREQWAAHNIEIPLVILESPYREINRPLVDYIRELHKQSPATSSPSSSRSLLWTAGGPISSTTKPPSCSRDAYCSNQVSWSPAGPGNCDPPTAWGSHPDTTPPPSPGAITTPRRAHTPETRTVRARLRSRRCPRRDRRQPTRQPVRLTGLHACRRLCAGWRPPPRDSPDDRLRPNPRVGVDREAAMRRPSVPPACQTCRRSEQHRRFGSRRSQPTTTSMMPAVKPIRAQTPRVRSTDHLRRNNNTAARTVMATEPTFRVVGLGI